MTDRITQLLDAAGVLIVVLSLVILYLVVRSKNIALVCVVLPLTGLNVWFLYDGFVYAW